MSLLEVVGNIWGFLLFLLGFSCLLLPLFFWVMFFSLGVVRFMKIALDFMDINSDRAMAPDDINNFTCKWDIYI